MSDKHKQCSGPGHVQDGECVTITELKIILAIDVNSKDKACSNRVFIFKVKQICMFLRAQQDSLPYSCHSHTSFKVHGEWQNLEDALDISLSEEFRVNIEVWVYWRVYNESFRCCLWLTTLTFNQPKKPQWRTKCLFILVSGQKHTSGDPFKQIHLCRWM